MAEVVINSSSYASAPAPPYIIFHTPCHTAYGQCLECALSGPCLHCAVGLELLYPQLSSPLLCLVILQISSKITSSEKPSQTFYDWAKFF